jgi:ABC-type glycerol-3-phosphate transport system substrate-binding protein
MPAFAAESEETSASGSYSYDMDSFVSESIEYSYTNVSKGYTAPVYEGDPYEIQIDQAYQSGDGVVTGDNYDYKNSVVKMEIGNASTFIIDVPETGQYFYRFDYLSYDESMLPVELSMQLNGEYPFYEARRLLFESTWVAKEEKSYDRYDNEIVTIPDKKLQWETKYLMDASYRHSTPLILELQKGRNEVTLTVSEGSVLLGNMYLEKVTQIPEYTSSQPAEGSELITIQAEDFTYRNDSSIRAVAEYDSAVAPYNTTDTQLNTIDRDSFKDAGQRITYEFDAPESGYYNIALNYIQSDKSGFPVFADVEVDGTIPNTAFAAYPLDYTTKYKTKTLKDSEGNKLSVYLEKGTHTISFTINIQNMCEVLEAVSRIMGEINDLSLEITKVAGTNNSKWRDLDITKYIPNIQGEIYGWADELDALCDSMLVYVPGAKEIAAFSSIKVASTQLRSFAKDPDEIPSRVAELSTSINSINTQLANLLDAINKNKLGIDRIYLYQEGAELPKKIGFFKNIYLSIERFFSSFFDQTYSASNADKDHIQVWVNRPRQYLEIMQKMIDETFTPETGIEVDLSLMPDPNKLVLANASGDAPDVATGINYAIPYDLGIRGAIKDLTEFDDFTEVASQYEAGLLIPSTIEDGIYALPETMNFWVLFYRTDILDKLGLEVPDTMEDVIDMLPELQMRGLNFYYPTAGMLKMRNFHGTTPLLFQNGATLYGEYAGDTTLNSEEAIKGLTELTDLFTIYDLPADIPNFYQHFRSGDLPIGIADYTVYSMLVNAAPEIADSWNISVIPGTVDENGEVLRYSSGGAESTVLFNSTEEREEKAWEFMKWWASAEVQAEFGQTLQISYGDDYMWNTANLEAFSQLPWDSKDKQVIIDQSKWVLEAPRILGTYMLERELSNAFVDIAINGKNLRTRIDKAVKVINRETERKLEEFGYNKDGEVITPYTVPTIDTVNEILGNTN